MDPEVIAQIDKGPFEKAYFLYHYALELNWLFLIVLQELCDKNHATVEGCIKNNLARIAQKIQDKNLGRDKNSQFRISDMTRATITVTEPGQMVNMYEAIE